jgi:hypothetical protein
MANMSWRYSLLHPTGGQLLRWLEEGVDDGVGLHVEHCVRCADRLEAFDREQPIVVDPLVDLRVALSQSLAPPSDLTDRVRRGVELRWQAERELALFAGLFAIGVETAQLMLGADADEDHNEPPTPGAEETTP